jgi:predicted amidohydrolase
MKTALIQLSSTDDPQENLQMTLSLLGEAAGQGAGFVLTPEVTNCISSSRTRQNLVLQDENDDITLAKLGAAAKDHKIWLLIGSLALKSGAPDGRFANRSFLISPTGAIIARYDKIHMFDVNVSASERYRESDGYLPGSTGVVAKTPFGTVGMTICYDVRFPHLYRTLAKAGAEILTVPAAFNDTTGAAHWETLLRARAIENGTYVLAPAQTGDHAAHQGRPRRTYGHSLAVSPWGEVLVDGGTDVGVSYVDIDLAEVAEARNRVPSLMHDRPFQGPN